MGVGGVTTFLKMKQAYDLKEQVNAGGNRVYYYFLHFKQMAVQTVSKDSHITGAKLFMFTL